MKKQTAAQLAALAALAVEFRENAAALERALTLLGPLNEQTAITSGYATGLSRAADRIEALTK